MSLGAPSFNATKGVFEMVNLRPSFVVERFLQIPKGNWGIDDRDDEGKPLLPFLSFFLNMLLFEFGNWAPFRPLPFPAFKFKGHDRSPKRSWAHSWLCFLCCRGCCCCVFPSPLTSKGRGKLFIWSGSRLCPTIPAYMFKTIIFRLWTHTWLKFFLNDS